MTRNRFHRLHYLLFAVVVLLFVAGAGLAIFWVMPRHREARAITVIESWGEWPRSTFSVHYDFEYDAQDEFIHGAPCPGPSYLDAWCGRRTGGIPVVVCVRYDIGSSRVSSSVRWHLSAADLAVLRDMTHLKAIDFSDVDLDPDGVVHLQAGGRLERLWLDGTNINDQGMADVSRVDGLRVLSITGCAVGDAGIVHLQRLQCLEELYIAGTQVSGRGLAMANLSPRLRVVHAGGVALGAEGARALARLPQLEELDVSTTGLCDEDLAHFRNHKYLRKVDLDFTRITDGAVEHLRTLPRVEEISVLACDLTEEGLQRLKKALPKARITPDTKMGRRYKAGEYPIINGAAYN